MADKANNDKNNGFYVDLKNDKWISPKSFSKEKYVLESRYTAAIVDYVKDTEKIFLDIKKLVGKTSS